MAAPASAHGAGITGWSETGALDNYAGAVQITGHASVVDDYGIVSALGGTIYYDFQDFGWVTDEFFHSPDWNFHDHILRVDMDFRNLDAYFYADNYWFVGEHANSPALCLWSASDHSQIQFRPPVSCFQPDRSGFSTIQYSGNLYVLGGARNGPVYEQRVQYAKLNSSGSAGLWRDTTPLPLPHIGSVAQAGGRLYAIGGAQQPTLVQSAPINPDGTLGAWRQEANQPPGRGPAVSVGNDIYVVGDSNGQVHYTTVAADGTLAPWQTSPHSLPVVGGHTAVARGSSIVVVGGRTSTSGSPNLTTSNKVYETIALSQPSNLELLARYKPELRYDLLETYRADSAATIADNCVTNPPDAEQPEPNSQIKILRQNYVNDSRARHLAASCENDRAAHLTLQYLGSAPGASSDRIDIANNYAEDAQRMHGTGDYPNRTYGRAVPNVMDGGLILQYWLFYYNNPKTYYTLGAHEGDWEMVQVHLGPDRSPTFAAYAQHGWGEKCPWEQVERNAGGRPVVYVADGSHASYFTAGFHRNPDPVEPWKFADDHASGGADWTVPVVEDITTPPGWLAWQGRWGGSEGTADSPRGPAFQGRKWTDPDAWSFGLKDCAVAEAGPAHHKGHDHAGSREHVHRSSGDRQPAAPPRPTLTVRKAGDQLVIRYRFDRLGRGRYGRAHELLTAVDGRRDAYPPLTVRTKVRGRRGTIRQPLGLAEGARDLLVSIVSRAGTRTRPERVRLREIRPVGR
jgi:hypothetical protein